MKLIAGAGKMNVKTIYAELKMEQSVASQQLKILRDANIVTFEREGQAIFYSMNESMCKTINQAMDLLLVQK
jgi:DNA-binding transcriptional ArsR family regulator